MGRTLPTPRNWLAGEVDTGAYMNAMRAWMQFMQTPPSAILRQTVAQALPTATWTAVSMDTEDRDTDGGHSVTTNTSRYTCQVAGMYQITGHVTFSAVNAGSQRLIVLRLNGSEINASTGGVPGTAAGLNGGTANVQTSSRQYLNVGDYIEVFGYQDSGANLNTGVSAGSASRLDLKWESL